MMTCNEAAADAAAEVGRDVHAHDSPTRYGVRTRRFALHEKGEVKDHVVFYDSTGDPSRVLRLRLFCDALLKRGMRIVAAVAVDSAGATTMHSRGERGDLNEMAYMVVLEDTTASYALSAPGDQAPIVLELYEKARSETVVPDGLGADCDA